MDIATESEFRDFMGEYAWAFWHRMPGIWLLAVPKEVTTFELRELVAARFPNMNIFICEAEEPVLRLYKTDTGGWFEKHWALSAKPVEPQRN
jgi:hypothetical protein